MPAVPIFKMWDSFKNFGEFHSNVTVKVVCFCDYVGVFIIMCRGDTFYN